MNGRAFIHASVFVALATTFVPSSSLGAGDPKKKEAQVLFDIALKQADAGDSAAALSSFRASYEKYPQFRVLYSIGKLCARTGDGACAVRAYDQYLREGGGEVPPKRRREVESEIKALSRTLAMVTIRSTAKDAEVKIDDEVVGKTPLSAPIAVSGGTHKIVLVHPQGDVDRSITVVAGESLSVTLDPKEGDPAARGPAPERAAEPEPTEAAADDGARLTLSAPEEPKAFPVVPWAVTGALAAATVVTGVLASSAYGDYQETRDAFPISRGELDDAQGKARDLLLLSSVLGVGTVVSLGVASYFTFFSPSSSSGPPPSKARVAVAVGPTGFAVHGVMP